MFVADPTYIPRYEYHEMGLDARKKLKIKYVPDEEDPTIIHTVYYYVPTKCWQRDNDSELDHEVKLFQNYKIDMGAAPETEYGWILAEIFNRPENYEH